MVRVFFRATVYRRVVQAEKGRRTVERGRFADDRRLDAGDFDGARVPRFRRVWLRTDRFTEVRKHYLVVACT